MSQVLKTPWPYFGGKSRIADIVWARLGDVDNFIEPFCGSAAVLLRRPTPPRIETINDADCMVANFWRATKYDPEGVAEWADNPVNEADLHAFHKWLVLSEHAAEFRKRMRSDPDYYDVKVAGRWCNGLCQWIGGGWCATSHVDVEQLPRMGARFGQADLPGVLNPNAALSPNRKPRIDGGANQAGHGIHAKGQSNQVPLLRANQSGFTGAGVNMELPEKLPRMTGARTGDEYYGGLGVHLDKIDEVKLRQKIPNIGGDHPGKYSGAAGVLASHEGHRPQLADAYDIGRGVCSNGDLGTCAARRAWLVEWFGRLRDRLRLVRVCCGDWLRVCDSESVTTRLGMTGIFFDPPYSAAAGRDMKLYAKDCGKVAHAVRAYCLERGANKQLRIALCGYSGEGHEELEKHGWDVIAWETGGGYGNRSAKGKANAKKERIFFSPGCVTESGLFDEV